MRARERRGAGLVRWAVVIAALALWAPPAEAGHAGHRLRRPAAHHHRLRRDATAGATRCSGGTCAPVRARAGAARRDRDPRRP